MALSVMINLDDMLFAAYNLGAEINETTPRLSKEELRTKLLADVPLIASKPAKKTKAAPKTETPTTETSDDEPAPETETNEKPKAEKKPKAEPEGDVRCCARSLYEKDHIEAGKPKVVREDEANQFGDRCKFKKVGETNFCKSHAEKQPHGVWGAEYAGKLKTLIEKANAPVEEPKPKPVKKVVKKATAKPATEESADEAKAPAKATKPAKRPAKKEDEDDESDVEEDADDEFMAADALEKANIEYEWTTINDQDYMIDSEGNVYDPESEEKVGVYDAKAKKWISGGPASE